MPQNPTDKLLSLGSKVNCLLQISGTSNHGSLRAQRF